MPVVNEGTVENGQVDPVETVLTQACKTVNFLQIHHFQYALVFHRKKTIHSKKTNQQ
jgi:hypothetical protein